MYIYKAGRIYAQSRTFKPSQPPALQYIIGTFYFGVPMLCTLYIPPHETWWTACLNKCLGSKPAVTIELINIAIPSIFVQFLTTLGMVYIGSTLFIVKIGRV
jgi:hypothetical protein